MSELFSPEWMQTYQDKWNAETDLSEALAKIDFTAKIGYGFKGDPQPKGIIAIENGKAIRTGSYNGETLNWDLRESEENWQKWMKSGLNMMNLAGAYMRGKLKFDRGDYGAMVKDPRMVNPFLKTFSVMGKV